jgi:FkbM family methyltransferase
MSQATVKAPHPIFNQFQRYRGPVREGSIILDFLGTTARREFLQSWIAPSPAFVETLYPEENEDLFAWIDLLTAVLEAEGRFTMFELGAGYGLWSVRGAKAAQQYAGLRSRLLAAEAEPLHFAWLQLHFPDNGLDPSEHQLVEAAVSDCAGVAHFYISSPNAEESKPNEWWGQSLIKDYEVVSEVTERKHQGRAVIELTTGWKSVEVAKVAMKNLLVNYDLVDFIHMDIQREELPAVRSSIEELDGRVKYVHIGTHSDEIEAGLREIFLQHGWVCRADYPGNGRRQTPFGELTFQDGVQSWSNPKLCKG